MKKSLSKKQHAVFNFQKKLFEKAKIFFSMRLVESEIFIICFVGLLVLSKVPYVNIVVTKNVIYAITIMLARQLFLIPLEWVVFVILVLFGGATVFQVIKYSAHADEMVNLAYFLLWYVCVLYILDVWKTIRKK